MLPALRPLLVEGRRPAGRRRPQVQGGDRDPAGRPRHQRLRVCRVRADVEGDRGLAGGQDGQGGGLGKLLVQERGQRGGAGGGEHHVLPSRM